MLPRLYPKFPFGNLFDMIQDPIKQLPNLSSLMGPAYQAWFGSVPLLFVNHSEYFITPVVIHLII
jgi:hypothetical protein